MKLTRAFVAVSFALFAGLLSAFGVERHGLFIGVNEYASPRVTPLYGCVRDAEGMQRACVRNGSMLLSNSRRMTDGAATLDAVREEMGRLAQTAAAGDLVVYYQSSHGGNYVDGDGNYTTDTCIRLYDGDYRDTDFADDLVRFKSGVTVIVVLDTCHSAGMFKGVRNAKDQAGWNFVARAQKRLMARKASAKGDAGPSVGWIAAADYDQYSWDDEDGAKFTTMFLEGWHTGDADSDYDGSLSFYELFDYSEYAAEWDGTVAQCENEDLLRATVAGVADYNVPENPPVLAGGALAEATEMVAYSGRISATGGTPPYSYSLASRLVASRAENSFSQSGEAKGWSGDESCWELTLPFDFPFFDETFRRVCVGSNGTLSFDGDYVDYRATTVQLRRRKLIAALFADLSTSDVYVQSSAAECTIRWAGQSYSSGGSVNFAVTLRKNGEIVIRYGSGNADGGVVGIFAGDGERYTVISEGNEDMRLARDVCFLLQAPPGLSLSEDGQLTGLCTKAGTYPFTVVVTDAALQSARADFSLTVRENANRPPVIEQCVPEGDGQAFIGDSRTFSVTALDPEGGALTYSWFLNGEPLSDTGSSCTVTFTDDLKGAFATVRCVVSDGLWVSATERVWKVALRHVHNLTPETAPDLAAVFNGDTLVSGDVIRLAPGEYKISGDGEGIRVGLANLALEAAGGGEVVVVGMNPWGGCSRISNRGSSQSFRISGITFRNVWLNGVSAENCLLTGCQESVASGCELVGCGIYGNETWDWCLLSWCTLRKCTVAGNICSDYVLDEGCLAEDSIVWDNACEFESGATFSNCCTMPMPQQGEGNFTDDPLLVAPWQGDLRLRTGSSCLNVASDGGNVGMYQGAEVAGFVVSVTVVGKGEVSPAVSLVNGGESVTVSATGSSHPLARWEIGGETVSTDPSYRIDSVTADVGLTAVFSPTNFYVDAVYGDDSNSGWSPAAAKRTLQAAVNAADVGELVYAMPGTYAPVDVGPKRIRIVGLEGPARTVIDGGGTKRCVTTVEWDGADVEGFTLTGGFAESGGGMYGGSLFCCIVSNNVAESEGGGTYYSRLVNCIVAGNVAGDFGGGFCYGSVENCTVTGNRLSGTTGEGAGGNWADPLVNSILTGNFAADGETEKNYQGNDNTISSCFMEGDPRLDADYRPLIDSPCIDAGSNESVQTETDLYGNVRIFGGRVDIGACEFLPSGVDGERCRVVFDLGIGSRTGGGEAIQYVVPGEAATAPEVTPPFGWRWLGWSTDFGRVESGPLMVFARYACQATPTPATEGKVVVGIGTTGTFSVAADAALGGSLSYSWFVDGARQEATDPSFSFAAAEANRGEHAIRCVIEAGGNSFEAANWTAVSGQEWFVDGTNGSDTYDGTATNTAFRTLQTAVGKASDYDVITVLPGVYQYWMQVTAKVLVRSTGGSGQTTISGNIFGVNGAPLSNLTIVGFTLADGQVMDCTVRDSVLKNLSGTCARLDLENCYVTGLQTANFSSGRFVHCTVVGNRITYGGMNLSLFKDCILLDNTDPYGSRLADTVADPRFVDAANGDFRLRVGSPCLGAASDGTNLGAYLGEPVEGWAITCAVEGHGEVACSSSFVQDGEGVTIEVASDIRPIDHFKTNGVWATDASTLEIVGVRGDIEVTAVFKPYTFYVDATKGDAGNDGVAPETPLANLQTAVSRALDGETVHVAPGVYGPITGTPNACLTIVGDEGATRTIIDGGNSSCCAYLHTSQYTNVVLRGFTLRNGRYNYGGGAYYGTLEDCILVGNHATQYGGGAYGSTLRHCTVYSNTADSGDGAISCGYAYDCILWNNASGYNYYYSYSTLHRCCADVEYASYADGSFTDDPLFVNAEQGDFRLRAGSPCLGAARDGGNIGQYQGMGLTGHIVTFYAGDHGSVSNSELAVQVVENGAAAVDPGVVPDFGWTFSGWFRPLDEIIADTTIPATYAKAWSLDRTNATTGVAYEGRLSMAGAEGVSWSFIADRYDQTNEAPSFIASEGQALGLTGDDVAVAYELPFDFPFFGNKYRTVYPSSNGALFFDGLHGSYRSYSDSTFRSCPLIAPLWYDLYSGEVYASVADDSVTFRWQSQYYGYYVPVNFSVTLYRTGRIRCSYGDGNAYGGFVGISAGDGDGEHMIIVDQTMGATHAKTRVDDIVFMPHGPVDWLELSEDGVLTGRPEESGTFAFTVIAADAAGRSIEVPLSITVDENANLRPEVQSVSGPADGSVVLTGSNCVYSVNVTDPQGDTLSYSWFVDGVCQTSTTSVLECDPVALGRGPHTVECRVTDGTWDLVAGRWSNTVAFCAYVDAARLDDSGDGWGPKTAKRTLQAAAEAIQDGETVVVADGVYEPINVQNKRIVIRSLNGPGNCIIDGGGTNCCANLGGTTNTVLEGLTLRNGNASYAGGAYYGTLRNCVLTGNVAEYGGGAYRATLCNCLVSGNHASWYGGGLYGGYSYNCTVVGNTADRSGGGTYNGSVYNGIVWGNEASSSLATSNSYSTTFAYSCTAPAASGEGNVCDDPYFCDPAEGDWRLREFSPCVGAGNVAYAKGETDLDGAARVVDGKVDMGAYQGGVHLPVPDSVTGVTATVGTGAGFVRISWATVPYARKYRVYRFIAGEDVATAEPIGETADLSWTDLTAVPGTDYGYWISAVNPAGESGYAAASAATGRALAPLAIMTDSFERGVVLVPYAKSMAATGGETPYVWSSAGQSYTLAEAASTWEARTDVPTGVSGDDTCREIVLPFAFPFYGRTYDRAWVGSNGTVAFDGAFTAYSPGLNSFTGRVAIAAFWTDLDQGDGAIYETVSDDAVTFTWNGNRYHNGSSSVNVALRLGRDGSIRVSFGPGNANGAALGVSAGDGERYTWKDLRNTSLAEADDRVFRPNGMPAGLELSPDGAISGTPTQAGSFDVAVSVTDRHGNVARTNATFVVEENSRTPIATPDRTACAEGEEVSISFRIGTPHTADSYAFLIPQDAASSNFVECSAFAAGVLIPAGATDATSAVTMRAPDGTSRTRYLSYTTVLRTAATLDAGSPVPDYITSGLSLSVTNVAPVILAPAERDGATPAELYKPIVNVWSVDDVEADVTNGFRVTFSTDDGNSVTFRNVRSGVATNAFTSFGERVITMTVTDKDGGSASRSWRHAINRDDYKEVTFDAGEHGWVDGRRSTVRYALTGQAVVPPSIRPDYSWAFDGWSGDLSCVDADRTVTAKYRTAYPDLHVDSVSNTTAAAAGGTVTVAWTVGNTGFIDFDGRMTERISLVSVADTNDVRKIAEETFSGRIARDGTVERTKEIALPLKGLEGDWYVTVETAIWPNVREAGGENLTVSPDRLHVDGIPLPDLKVSDVVAPTALRPGDTVTVSYATANVGASPADAIWKDEVWLETVGGTPSRLRLGTIEPADALGAGESRTTVFTYVLPELITLSGEVRFVVTTDVDGEIVEVDDAVNNTAASATCNLSKRLYLTLSSDTVRENSSSGVRLTLKRSGDRADSLSVALGASGATSDVTYPDSLTIPVNGSSTTVSVVPVDNETVEGPRAVTFSVASAGFESAECSLVVEDNEVPRLTVTLDRTTIREGAGAITATVTRELVTDQPLTVYLSGVNTSRCEYPETVVIAAGERSATFVIEPVDNDTAQVSASLSLRAAAEGYETTTADYTVEDDDVPGVTLALAPQEVTEGGLVYATLTRSDTNQIKSAVTVVLKASEDGQLTLNESVTIPAYTMSVRFAIYAVDNGEDEGDRTVAITGAIRIPSCGCNGQPSNGDVIEADLIIRDNDGPSLSLQVDPPTLREDVAEAGWLTISHNSTLDEDLTVNLQHDGPNEISIAETATIPAGETSVRIPVSTLDDGVEDGSKLVSIYVDDPSGTFASGSTFVQVSDQNLPDAVVAEILPSTLSIVGLQEFDVTFAISNCGFMARSGSVPYELHLVKGADSRSISASTRVATGRVSGPLAVGGSIFETVTVTAPDVPGDYRFAVVVDPEGTFAELDKANNTGWSPVVGVEVVYSAVVAPEQAVYEPGSTVVLTGSATRTSVGTPAAKEPVEVYVLSDGIRRTVTAETDDSGFFTAEFVPQAGEGGHYEVGASYPGADLSAVQAEFDIPGVRRVGSGYLTWDFSLGEEKSLTFTVRNPSEVPVRGLSVAADPQPEAGAFEFSGPDEIAGGATATYTVTARAVGITDGTQYEYFDLVLATDDGLISLDVPAAFYAQAKQAYLRATPPSRSTTVTVGKATYLTYEIYNAGLGETGPVRIDLPDVSWMRSVSGNTISGLKPGESATLTLELTPPMSLILNKAYTAQLAVSCEEGRGNSIGLGLSVIPVSEETGSLRVDVTDVQTLTVEGSPHVSNATVRVTNPGTGVVVAEGRTGADGIFEAFDIPAGNYQLAVEAEQHSSKSEEIQISPGVQGHSLVYLEYQAVSYVWRVVPTEIEDEYRIDLVMEYATHVPAPAMKIHVPESIPELKPGESHVCQVVVENSGLVKLVDIRVSVRGSLGDYTYEQISPPVKEIPAKTSVPIYVRFSNPLKPEPVPDGPMAKKSPNELLNCSFGLKAVAKALCGDEGIDLYAQSDNIVMFGAICDIANLLMPTGPTDNEKPLRDGGPSTSTVQVKESEPIESVVSMDCGCGFKIMDTLVGRALGDFSIPSWAYKLFQNVLFTTEASTPEQRREIVVEYLRGRDGYEWLDSLKKIGDVAGSIKTCWSTITGFLGKGGSSPKGSTPQAKGDDRVFDYPEYGVRVTMGALYKVGGALAYYEYHVLYDGVDMEVDPGFVVLEGANRCRWGRLIEYNGWFDFEDEEHSALERLMYEVYCRLYQLQNVGNRIVEFSKKYGTGGLVPEDEIEDDKMLADAQKVIDAIEVLMADARKDNITTLEGIFEDLAEKASKYVEEGAAADSLSVCSTVTLKLSQTVAMTREAFEGTLTLKNGSFASNLSSVKYEPIIKNADGRICNDLFGVTDRAISGAFKGKSFLEGDLTLASGETGDATVLFVPTVHAAEQVPTVYYFGGKLSYVDESTGLTATYNLTPVPLTVNPCPYLTFDYFVQRDVYADDPFTEDVVEASMPAEFAVRIRNDGYGEARNTVIHSAQPELVENEKGLCVDFALKDYALNDESALNGSTAHLGLQDVRLGTIAPQSTVVAQWWLTSSIEGHFKGVRASVTHLNSWGNPDTSLIGEVRAHRLIRSITADQDALPDFLTATDLYGTPDRLYLSNGDDIDVRSDTTATLAGKLSGADPVITLTVTSKGPGWSYATALAPGLFRYKVAAVTREDGTELDVRNVWITDRTFVDGKNAELEERIHLSDGLEETGDHVYTIRLEAKPGNAVVVAAFEDIENGAVEFSPRETLTVAFSNAIDAASFTVEDLSLIRQGEILEDISELTIEPADDTGTRFTIGNLSAYCSEFGQFNLTVQCAGIADIAGQFGTEGRIVRWSYAGSDAPSIVGTSDIPLGGVKSFDSFVITFSRPIRAETFGAEAFTLDGLPGHPALTVTPVAGDVLKYTVSGLDAAVVAAGDADGEHVLSIDARSVLGEEGNACTSVREIRWTRDTHPPVIETFRDDRNSVVRRFVVTFDEDVSSKTAGLVEFSLTRNGAVVRLPSTASVSVSGHSIILTGVEDEALEDGAYELTFNAERVMDLAHNEASGSRSVSWTVDTTPPAAAANLAADTGYGSVDTVVRTSERSMTLSGVASEPGVSVQILSRYATGRETLLATPAVAGDGSFSAGVLLPENGGSLTLIVRVTDASGRSTDSEIQAFYDKTPLTAELSGAPAKDRPADVLTLTFSDAVETDDVTLGKFALTRDGESVALEGVTLGADANGSTFRLYGLTGLCSVDGAYELSFAATDVRKRSTGLKASACAPLAWSYACPDSEPPTVASVAINGEAARDVYTNGIASVEVVFSEAVNLQELYKNGLIAQALRIQLMDGTLAVTGSVYATWHDVRYGTDRVTWTLPEGAVGLGRARLVIDAGLVRDLAGNGLVLGGFAAADGLCAYGFGNNAVASVDSYAMPTWYDCDGDGLGDLVVGEKTASGAGKVRVYRNTGTASAPQFGDYAYLQAGGADLTLAATGCQGAQVAFGDLTGDGLDDLIVGYADGKVDLWAATARGVYGSSVTVRSGSEATYGSDRAFVCPHDLDGDGRLELVIGGLDGKFRALAYVAGGESTETWLTDTNGGTLTVANGRSTPILADVNGDGCADILTGDTSGSVKVYLAEGGAWNGTPVTLFDNSTAGRSDRSRIGYGDVNGDGIGDLLVGRTDGSVTLAPGARTDSPSVAFRCVDPDQEGTVEPEEPIDPEDLTLGVAVNAPDLAWTTGGAADWTAERCDEAFEGRYCAFIRNVGNNATAWMQTTVDGPGEISFAWMCDLASKSTKLQFFVDDVAQGVVSGSSPWTPVRVTVYGEGAHVLKWRLFTGRSGAAATDVGAVDAVTWTPTVPPTLAEALNTNLTWKTSGARQWRGVAKDSRIGARENWAVASGLDDDETAAIETKVYGNGLIVFDWGVSCEEEYDWLEVSVDGKVKTYITGEAGWTTEAIDIIGEGWHVVRWEYIKDEMDEPELVGDNTAMLDNVTWVSDDVPPEEPPEPEKTATENSPVPVPFAEFDTKYKSYLDAAGGDYEAAALAVGKNGCAIWESYVAGLDPDNPDSKFRIVDIKFEDGEIKVTWSPDLNENGTKNVRNYTEFGRKELGGTEAWTDMKDVAPAEKNDYKFRKVTVDMP